MLKLSINAQGSRVITVVVQVGAVKIFVAAVEALRKKERGDETQFTTKIGGKTLWVPVILFPKISFPVTHMMSYYAETAHSRPPNRLTLRITLLLSGWHQGFLSQFCDIAILAIVHKRN
jgi:NADH:ubiquinone oxidoreductase subunit 6 (subunit J)